MCRVQFLHAPIDPPPLVGDNHLLFRTQHRVVGKVIIVGDIFGDGLSRPHRVDRMVSGNGREPGRGTSCPGGECLGPLPNLDVNFLKGFLGLCPVPEYTKTDRKEFRAGALI